MVTENDQKYCAVLDWIKPLFTWAASRIFRLVFFKTVRSVMTRRISDVDFQLLLGVLLALSNPWMLHANGQIEGSPAYRVGVAKVDVTPKFPVRLSGFSDRHQEASEVRHQLFARAMAIQAGDQPAVLVTVDSIGIPAGVRAEVAERLQAKRGLPGERLAICSTHSHTTPALAATLPTMYGEPVPVAHQTHIDEYTRQFTDGIEQAAERALDDLKPARLSFGVGKVGFAINRRTRGGPVDHDLPLLVVTRAGGKICALYVNYACHCVVFHDYKIGGDWAGYAAEQLEREHPGAIGMVSIGCGGDANPESGVSGREDLARHYGDIIAADVQRLLNGKMADVTGELTCQLQSVRLALQKPKSREEWQEQAKRGGIDGYYASYQVAKLDAGEKLPTEVTYPIQTWKFGRSLAMVFLGGEVVVDYSLRLKREFDASRLWINAYSNAAPAYIPSERVLAEGGYEAGQSMHFYGLPAWFARGLEDKICSVVHGQLGEKFKVPAKAAQTSMTPAKSPQESLATFHVAKGLRVELMASEPAVRSPVAIDFGPDGKLWVAQMIDYGCRDGEECPPMGRVSALEDRDGDGIYEMATVFLDNVSCPMGVSVWRKGVLICAAPDILYAEDANGDGHADIVRKLFSGFGTEHPQARVNGFAPGLDGWMYAACSSGGTIKNYIRNEEFSLADGDFRLKPDEGVLEPETGHTQQSRVRDDWGNWYGCHNSELCFHFPLANRYVLRNPLVVPPTLAVPVAGPEATKLYPSNNLVLFALSGPPGRATAACGIGIYRDDVLGPEYYNNVFTCEAVNQLVHRMVLKPSGATFVGERAAGDQHSEFVTSTDNWFRPVEARTGPDGALWIVDMYRYVIEHPRWIPGQDLKHLDIAAARAYGRIYRVLPEDKKGRPFKRLDDLSLKELVAAMDSPNGWQRDMVQQLLTWQPKEEAIEPLKTLSAECARPATRVQALCTLGVLSKLSDDVLEQALRDGHPGVRRQAVRLAERRLKNSPQLVQRLLAMREDPDASVAVQLACTLGELDDVRVVPALAELARRHADDKYVLAGVLSSIHESRLGYFMRAVFKKSESALPIGLVEQILEYAAAVDDGDALHAAIKVAMDGMSRSDHRQFAPLAALFQGLRRNKGQVSMLLGYSTGALQKLCEQASRAAGKMDANLAERIDAVHVIGRTRWPSQEQIGVLSGLLSPDVDPQLQNAAIEALSLRGQESVAGELLASWSGYTPSLRSRVLDVLLRRKPWAHVLIMAIEAKQISPSEVDAVHRYQLKNFPDKEIQEMASRHFSDDSPGQRAAIVAKYQEEVAAIGAGDAGRGDEIFRKHCSSCHKLKGIGQAVGPDLAAFKDKSSNALIGEILDPNRAVDQRYAEYLALTIDGQAKKGVLAEETGNSITLRGLQGEETTLLRSELDSLTTVGKSLMPEGLEKELSVQDLADVIAFVAAP